MSYIKPKIYLDFDDVIAETARRMSELLLLWYEKDVPYENIRYFDLRKSFDLEEAEYRAFMERAHGLDILLGLDEIPGACSTIKAWARAGLDPYIITGRPPSGYEGTRKWLDAKGLDSIPVLLADKYSRQFAELDENAAVPVYQMHEIAAQGYDLVVEDAPIALELLARHKVGPAVVFDRPWNREMSRVEGVLKRVTDWTELDVFVRELLLK